MSESALKTFDCVQSMRQVRDEISAEIADMDFEELVKWFRSHHYADPLLQRLAGKTVQRAEAGRR